jgi:NADH-quinone oxidoreductase subunit L
MFEFILILIPALPLLSAIITAILGPRVLDQKSHVPTIVAFVGSLVCSLGLSIAVKYQAASRAKPEFERVVTLWQWTSLADAYDWRPLSEVPAALSPDAAKRVPFQIDVALRADSLTAIMLVMVTFIATLVAIYSAGYMHGDRGYWRFFSYVSLFVFSMTMLVSVSNFVLLFVFWEAVGLCSYLLIGFWYEKPEAAAAGKKAFLVNRVGDFGFALAIFLIWTTYGTLNFHDTLAHDDTVIHGVFGQQRLSGSVPYATGTTATWICLLLMLGACGKSAQFPLHVWLPDAMEGPSPVSALIHAATMVTAGVYMVIRCTPLFFASPDAQVAVACVGGFTALLAGLIALTQNDLKRVLAYSTISQLGYMFLALGTGTLAGIVAGMFHLFTHAFFKALLFLGAGSVMHSMGNVIDLRRLGGLRRVMPWTHVTFAIGCLALAGIFPFAGFWSKDAIIAAVHQKAYPNAHAGSADESDEHSVEAPESDTASSGLTAERIGLPVLQNDRAENAAATHADHRSWFRWLYWASLFTAFLTAFYTFRAFFMTFYGDRQVGEEAAHHAHESPPVMWVPLAILAACVFAIGWVLLSEGSFAAFLGSTPSLTQSALLATAKPAEFHVEIAIISSLIAAAGIAMAAYLYLEHRHEIEFISSLRLVKPLKALSYRKFFLDELYEYLIVKPFEYGASFCYLLDRWLVDGLVNLVGRLPVWSGAAVRRLQNGLVPFYSLAMVCGLLLVLLLCQLYWSQ